MKLSIMERLLILNLPITGSIVTLRIAKKLLDDVGFNEDEIIGSEIRTEGNNVKWKVNSDPMKDIEMGDQALNLVIGAMEQSASLNPNHLTLYDKLLAVKAEQKQG